MANFSLLTRFVLLACITQPAAAQTSLRVSLIQELTAETK